MKAGENQTKAAAREGGRIENSQTENPKRSQRAQMNTNRENRTQPEFEQGNGGRIRMQLNKIDPDFCKNQTEIKLESINYKKFETQS